MTQRTLTIVASLFLTGLVATGSARAADSESAAHHPGTESAATAPAAPAMPSMEMMKMMGQGQQMMDMMKRKGTEHSIPSGSCMEKASPTAGLRMMDAALSGRMMMEPGMMHRMMAHAFYLDRVAKLGLSAEQVKRLRTIQGACRRDNIRTGAEIRIARLDLDDLLSSNNWTLEAAEKLVRHQQKLEGDMQVRHLQALVEARRVLTPEQLQKAESVDQKGDLQGLFD